MAFFTTTDDALIYYETWGIDIDKPTVVFLNGTAQTTMNWRSNAKAMTDRFGIVLYDARTQGQSEMGRHSPLLNRHVSDLKGLMDHLSIAKAHFIGMSHGAMVALALATDHRQVVDRLVLCSLADTSNRRYDITLNLWLKSLDAGGLVALAWIIVATMFGVDFLTLNSKNIHHIVDGIVNRNTKESLASQLEAMLDYNSPGDYIPRLRCASLFISGGKDPFAKKNAIKKLANKCNGEHIHLPALGHAVPLENPSLFLKKVTRFLTKEIPKSHI